MLLFLCVKKDTNFKKKRKILKILGILIQLCFTFFSAELFRGMEDESGDQFVAYFLPTDDTLGKKKEESRGKDPIESEE